MQKKNIGLMYALSFLQGMVFYASVATLYRQSAGVSLFEITVIESASLALSLMLEVPWGVWAERMGYRRTMCVCSALFFVSKVVFWRADGFGMFLLERLLLAVVISGLSGVDESVLYASCEEKDMQRIFGRYSALGTAGLMLASLICSVWLGKNYRLMGLLTVLSYGAAVVCTLFLSEVKPPEREKRQVGAQFRAHLREMLHTPGLLLLVLCSAVFLESAHTVTVFLNQVQYARCGWSTSAISAAYVLGTLLGLCSAASDRVCARFGTGRTGRALLLGSALSCGLLAVTRSGWLSLGCILLLCLAQALYGPLAGAMENRLVISRERATALSVHALLQDSVAIGVNLVLGRAADAGLPLAFILCGVMCLAALALFSGALHRTGQGG